jgi:TetR/AcrR family transcriptional regulator, copper-responsive repressor
MGRHKEFTREEVLEKAIPVFWEHGYADTGVHELEKATGVNKSGLYSEFKSKEDLFLCSLQHYLETSSGRRILSTEPLGWNNVEELLRCSLLCPDGQKGCFAISSMREFAILPQKAHEIIARNRAEMKELLLKNIRAEKPKTDPTVLAELISTFFSGLCVEQNLDRKRPSTEREIRALMTAMRGS